LQTYGQEQETLDKEIPALQSTVERYENGRERAKNFINLVERYTDFTEITVTMLNEFIEKIVVLSVMSGGLLIRHRRLKYTLILSVSIYRPRWRKSRPASGQLHTWSKRPHHAGR